MLEPIVSILYDEMKATRFRLTVIHVGYRHTPSRPEAADIINVTSKDILQDMLEPVVFMLYDEMKATRFRLTVIQKRW